MRVKNKLKASYRYNGLGQRVLKTDAATPANSRQYVYDSAGLYTLMLAAGMQIVRCPQAIQDTQNVVAESGWNVSVGKYARRLDRVMVYSGEPSHRRSLMPVPVRNRSRWGFAGEDIWVECRYLDSAAVLTRNLRPVTSCSFTPRRGGTSNQAKLVCEKPKKSNLRERRQYAFPVDLNRPGSARHPRAPTSWAICGEHWREAICCPVQGRSLQHFHDDRGHS